MATARWLVVMLLPALTAGCCSYEPEDLAAADADDRREALACLAEDAAEDAGLRTRALTAARARLHPADEPSPAVRAAAARALGHLQAESSREELIGLLREAGRDPHPHVRAEAARSLRLLGGVESVAALRAALRDDPALEVRLAAASGLGALGDNSPDTTEALFAGLRDTDVDVRLSAHRSLCKLHGCDQGTSVTRWRAWYDGGGAEPASPEGLPVQEPLEAWPETEPGFEDEPAEPALSPEEEFPDEPVAPFGDESRRAGDAGE